MPGAKNQVIAGEYLGKEVVIYNETAIITVGIFRKVALDYATVESYEVVDATTRVSAASAVGRAAVGSLLLGPIGLTAALSAKSKGIYTIAIQFKDGKRSLLEVDDKIYKAIIRKVF